MKSFKKTLIVEQNRSYVLQIKEILADHIDEVEFCFDGKTAIEIYDEFCPDLVLVEAILPIRDGFTLMEHIVEEEDVVKIMLTSMNHDLIIKKASDLKSDYLFIKPYHNETFKQRVIEAAEFKFSKKNKGIGSLFNKDYSEEVSEALNMLGIPAKIKGYKYLKEALEIVCNDRAAMNAINEKIYRRIAADSNTTAMCVERNIRHAIEIAVLRGSHESYAYYFGYSIDSNKGKPTNGEFIAAIAEKIKD